MVKKLPDAHAVRLQTKAVPRVAILLDTAHEFGREVIRGIGNFSLLSESWFLDVIDPALPQRRLAASLSRCDGAIGRVETTAMFRFISRNKLPFVCLISAVAEAEELVGTNQAILCRLALGHMRERGFRELAFYGRHLRHGRVRFKILERIAPEFDCQITSLRIGAVMTPEVLVPQLAKLPIPAEFMGGVQ